MVDREKVIEKLRKVSYYFKSLLAVGWQGDADIYTEHMESVNMAIALLKEQEPAKVRHLHGTKVTVHAEIVFEDACENCGSCLLKHWKACPICGKPVKWE